MWNCPKCGEQIEDQFDSCWKCAAVPEQLDDSKAGPAMMTGCAIGVLFMAALILAVLFAVVGAGLYGSPFDLVKTSHEYALYAATILVGPLASLVALVFHKRLPYLSGVSLVLGAAAGVLIGLVVESDFRYFWGKVFVIVVWLPMSVVGARILLRKPQP